jgi:hypothetical protein
VRRCRYRCRLRLSLESGLVSPDFADPNSAAEFHMVSPEPAAECHPLPAVPVNTGLTFLDQVRSIGIS